MKVAIQGIAGSFHEQAAHEIFNAESFKTLECATFRDVFDAVTHGTADYGIVAVENSLHGPINPVYRLLASEKLNVSGECRLHIKLYLCGHTDLNLDTINNASTEILSHPAALSECEGWLNKNLPLVKRREVSDTGGAVRHIMKQKSPALVAVAGQQAADLYKAAVLTGPINDDPENYTRFFVITKKQFTPPDADRTSIILTEAVTDQAGTLYDALGVFAKFKINLSKLDSHPLPGQQRKYAFYIDFDDNIASPKGKQAIEQLKKLQWHVTVLGSYKSYKH